MSETETGALGDGRIESRELEQEMRSSFLDYAMSVIVARALPDVRDGLKPVHRRVLYSMWANGNRPGRPYVKCANIVGYVMGNHHPHGDSAIYDTLVRLAQPFSLRYPLVDGQGNFGSIDDDPAAAMRYCLSGRTRVATADGTVPDRLARSRRRAGVRARRSISRCSTASAAPSRRRSSSIPESIRRFGLLTREGYELVGTHNHPVLCLVDMAGVPAAALEAARGDQSRRPRALIARAPRTVGLDFSDHDRDTALLLGAFVSEGWSRDEPGGIRQHRSASSSMLCSARTTLLSAGRGTCTSGRSPSGKHASSSSTFRTCDSLLRRERLGRARSASRAREKAVPELRLAAARTAFKRVFLQALFTGDGSSSLLPRNTIQVSYSTYSEQLAKDVQLLLLEFGVDQPALPVREG